MYCFYKQLILGSIKHAQASTEARGLPTVTWVCNCSLTSPSSYSRLVLWFRAHVANFQAYIWIR